MRGKPFGCQVVQHVIDALARHAEPVRKVVERRAALGTLRCVSTWTVTATCCPSEELLAQQPDLATRRTDGTPNPVMVIDHNPRGAPVNPGRKPSRDGAPDRPFRQCQSQ